MFLIFGKKSNKSMDKKGRRPEKQPQKQVL
jgi:hypothetical protein